MSYNISENQAGTFNSVVDMPAVPGKYHVKVEKNTKGYNWTASAYGETVEEALESLELLTSQLRQRYGE